MSSKILFEAAGVCNTRSSCDHLFLGGKIRTKVGTCSYDENFEYEYDHHIFCFGLPLKNNWAR
jgi:hypothetical protein